MSIRFLYLGLIFLLFSCTQENRRLQEAMDIANINDTELTKVLDHYRNEPKKRKAASFLFENMTNKYFLDSSSVASVQPYYDALIDYYNRHGDYGTSMMYYVCDSIGKYYISNLQPIYKHDLKHITADFLIDHIDRSFEAWRNNPQTRNIGFYDFCKYILPYRCDEKTFWEGIFPYMRNIYGPMTDSLKTESVIEVGKSIDKQIKDNFRQDGIFIQHYPFLQPTTQYNYVHARIGLCAEANYTVISALRSIGIPAAFNLIPYWGNSNAAHSWTEIIGDNPPKRYDNQQAQYEGPQSEIISDMFWYKRNFDFFDGIPGNVSVRWCRTVPKVFRENYAIQKNNLASLSNGWPIPAFFQSEGLEDITDKYIECTDVKIRLNRDSIANKFAYLCCYVPETYSWTPVAWGRIGDNGAVRFEKVGKNIVYMPAYYTNGQVVPAASPFLLDAKGKVVPLETSQETEPEAVFYSKVPYRAHVLYYARDMLNGKFQLANNADMSDTLTVYTITKLPFFGQELKIDDAPPSRYGIYNFAGTKHGFIAELEFYGPDENGNETKLSGELVGNPGIYGSGSREMADGGRVSCFIRDKTNDSNYVGIDFGKPRKVTRIVYHPRSDDNGIVPGELYELFYWKDGGWISLGKQTGREDKTLVYTDIPKNTLMRLHDITLGNENRIFIYKDGKQIFY